MVWSQQRAVGSVSVLWPGVACIKHPTLHVQTWKGTGVYYPWLIEEEKSKVRGYTLPLQREFCPTAHVLYEYYCTRTRILSRAALYNGRADR